MQKICKDCKQSKNIKDFYGIQNDCKECYKQRVKTQKYRLGKDRICDECKKGFKALQSEISRGGGITCSRECYYKRLKRIVKRDSDSPNWKGSEVGNGGLHDWVRKKKGTPSKCEHCGRTDAKRYDWSNISHKYKRDLSDWQRLCRKCHIKFDNHTEKWRKTVSAKHGWKVKL